MSFGTEIYTKMIGSSSINSQVKGVYFEHLPENFDLTKNYIVYSFKKETGISTLSTADLLKNYKLYVKTITPNNNTLLSLSDTLQTYLIGVVDSSIRFVDFVSDNHSLDLEKGIYENTLEFNVLYT